MKGSEAKESILPDPIAVEQMEAEATTTTPEIREEARVEFHPSPTTGIVLRKKGIEDPAPLRSLLMESSGSSSHQGLELLDDELIDPTVAALNLESWRRTDLWVKVGCEYRMLSYY